MSYVRKLIEEEIEGLEKALNNRRRMLALLEDEDTPPDEPCPATERGGQLEVAQEQPKRRGRPRKQTGEAQKRERKPMPEGVKRVAIAHATEENLENVREVLRASDEPLSEKEIREAAELDGKATKCLNVLMDNGELVQHGAKRGTKYQWKEHVLSGPKSVASEGPDDNEEYDSDD